VNKNFIGKLKGKKMKKQDIDGSNKNREAIKFTDDPIRLKRKIAREIERCPPRMAIIELFRNALQVKDCTEIHFMKVYYPLETDDNDDINEAKLKNYTIMRSSDINSTEVTILVPKLMIRNNGTGIKKENMEKFTAIGDSGDDSPIHERFGSGSKTATLSHSPSGVFFTSLCEETYSSVMLNRYHDRTINEYSYDRVLMDDNRYVWDSEKTVSQMISAILSIEKNYEKMELLSNKNGDYTSVILFGKDFLEDTTLQNGYGWVDNAILDRFVSFKGFNENCKVFVENSISSNKKNNKNKEIFSEIGLITESSKKYDNDETVIVNDLEIRYIYDSTETKGFLALNYENEIYFSEKYGQLNKEGHRWYSYCRNFGIENSCAKHVTIIIKLLSENKKYFPNEYRVHLFSYSDKDKIVDAKDFADIVEDNQPKWLQDLNNKSAIVDNDELLKELNNIGIEAFSKTKILHLYPSKNGSKWGTNTANSATIQITSPPSGSKVRSSTPPAHAGVTSTKTVQTLAPISSLPQLPALPPGTMKASQKRSQSTDLPKFHFMDNIDEIRLAGLEDHIASFEDKTLRVNLLHSFFILVLNQVINSSNTVRSKNYTSVVNLVQPVIRKEITKYLCEYFARMRDAENIDISFRPHYKSSISKELVTHMVQNFEELFVSRVSSSVNPQINKMRNSREMYNMIPSNEQFPLSEADIVENTSVVDVLNQNVIDSNRPKGERGMLYDAMNKAGFSI